MPIVAALSSDADIAAPGGRPAGLAQGWILVATAWLAALFYAALCGVAAIGALVALDRSRNLPSLT